MLPHRTEREHHDRLPTAGEATIRNFVKSCQSAQSRRRDTRIALFASLLLAVGLNACGSEPGTEASTTNEPVGTVVAAQSVAETTIDSQTNINLTETSASAFQAADGTWEMFNSTNSSGGRFDYSCTANDYGKWCDNAIFLGSGNTAINGDTNNVSANGFIYAVALTADQTGLWFMRTQDPCPGRNGACPNSSPWSTSREVLGNSGQIDFPDIITNPVNGDIWLVYRRNTGTGGGSNIGLARFQKNQTWNTNLLVRESNCSALSNVYIDRVRAAFDSSGNIHIAYADELRSEIHHEVFSTSSNTYQCQLNKIGPYTLPVDNCGCGLPVIPNNLSGGAGISSCVRSLLAPSISIDRSVNPNVLMVAYESPGSGGCANKTETEFWRSTNSGTNWSETAVTGCQTAVQPRIVFPNQSGAPAGVLQTLTTYNTPGKTTLSQVTWRSTDEGVTWSGSYISPERTVSPLGTCYTGDYNGIAADTAHGSYFDSWSQLSGSNWVNRGFVQNQ